MIPIPSLDQWQKAPHLAWSMQNLEAFLPVRTIPRGTSQTQLESAPMDLSAVSVLHPWQDFANTFSDVMLSTCTDGWIVTKDGAVVGEQYHGSMTSAGVHLLMSVSKSLTAAVAGTLIGTHQLDPNGLVTTYVPALVGSAYEGARVQDLLDMRTGVKFSEHYLDPDAEVRLLEEAIGWAPRIHPATPGTLLAFLASLTQEQLHGGRFDYKSCETDALGFVLEGATGHHAAALMSDLLWQPMGAEADAHVGVDSIGAGMFDGGVSASLRDLARFGNLFLREGNALDGRTVLPPSWVAETFAGAPDSREAFALSPEPTLMPGGMYRNGFWFPREGSNVMLALGIHGQMIYINRSAGVVAAKLSSWPTPQDGEKLLWTVRAFDAVSAALT